MNRLSLALAAIILPVLSTASLAQSDVFHYPYIKHYPQATEGLKRVVINLPHKESAEEGDFRVELQVGKKVMTDGVNRYGISGEIQVMLLKDSELPYYEVKAFGPTLTTLVGVHPDNTRVEKLLTLPPIMIRYNSRIPVVLYVPEDAVVNYRVWTAPEFQPADAG